MPRDKKRGTGGKFRRGTKNGGNTLTEEDVTFLCSKTKKSEEEVKEWFSGFIEDNPSGTLGMSKMLEMYAAVLPEGKAKVFVDQIFAVFDTDNSGSIDFKEFMLATTMTEARSPEDKLRWAFRLYDKDGSGTIDSEEMTEIITNLCSLEGLTQDVAEERAAKVFQQLDVNDDGELNEEEFVFGALKDATLTALISGDATG